MSFFRSLPNTKLNYKRQYTTPNTGTATYNTRKYEPNKTKPSSILETKTRTDLIKQRKKRNIAGKKKKLEIKLINVQGL